MATFQKITEEQARENATKALKILKESTDKFLWFSDVQGTVFGALNNQTEETYEDCERAILFHGYNRENTTIIEAKFATEIVEGILENLG